VNRYVRLRKCPLDCMSLHKMRRLTLDVATRVTRIGRGGIRGFLATQFQMAQFIGVREFALSFVERSCRQATTTAFALQKLTRS
jgi:hypothetical protein